MKENLKKLTIFIIAICILFMSSSATYGATVENNTTQMYSLTTMEYQGQIIEIPVLTQTTMSKLRNSVFTSEVYVFIPDMTEETMEKNEEYVKEIKRTGNCSAMRQARSIYFGLPGYIAYHSTLNYNVSYYQGYLRLYDLISFKLEREIYTQAPFRNFYNATAKALQVGTIGDPGKPEVLQNQQKEYGEIKYDTLYTIPSEWVPIAPVDSGTKVGVKYVVKYEYADGTVGYLEQFHEVQ